MVCVLGKKLVVVWRLGEKLEYKNVRFGKKGETEMQDFSDGIDVSASLPKVRKSIESEGI